MANRTKNPLIIGFAQRQVTLTDFVFTAGGAGLLLIAGMANIGRQQMSIMDPSWLLWGLVLFSLSGLIWVAMLIPIQIKQAKEAKSFTADTVISAAYWRRELIWYVAGITATILPLIKNTASLRHMLKLQSCMNILVHIWKL